MHTLDGRALPTAALAAEFAALVDAAVAGPEPCGVIDPSR
jgi:hypothetical protein